MTADASSNARFVVLEGIEGSGKSTQLATVVEALRAMGIEPECTREPGGTALGERLRGLLLDPDLPGMCPEAELLLMFAARAQHLASVIRPALAAGRWVVSDRFTDASFAYQGAGRGLGAERVARLEEWVQGELRPDLVLLLDIDPATGLERAVQRGRRDRIELEALDFFARVREAYLDRARAYPERYRIIDGHAAPEQVAERVRQALQEWHTKIMPRGA
ncbi:MULTISPECIES: dTMP kinase [unclassified Thioalkalivibrio]|uniref:dTMP kinase n=1 Tax=unclassified Thioalkalivibrio TaxID=2621013 RepID=UPI0003653AFB|nr:MULTISPECIES: dTMP kinase [unclassified Thioalkalivibrio]